MKRRERTRQLIELGGLVVKAALIELTDDDRAVLFGAFVEIAARLRSDDRDQALMMWRRRGKRAFTDYGTRETIDTDISRPGLGPTSPLEEPRPSRNR